MTSTPFSACLVLIVGLSLVDSAPYLKKNPASFAASISSFKESLSTVFNGSKVVLKPLPGTIKVEKEVNTKPIVVVVMSTTPKPLKVVTAEPVTESMEFMGPHNIYTGEIVVDFSKEEEALEEMMTMQEVVQIEEEEEIPVIEEEEIVDEEDNELNNNEEVEMEENEIEEHTEEEHIQDQGSQIVISKTTFLDAVNSFIQTLLKAKTQLHEASKGKVLVLSKNSLEEASKPTRSIRRNDATDRLIDEFSLKVQNKRAESNEAFNATHILEIIKEENEGI